MKNQAQLNKTVQEMNSEYSYCILDNTTEYRISSVLPVIIVIVTRSSATAEITSEWLKLQASNVVQLLIRSVLTRKLKFIFKGTWPQSCDLVCRADKRLDSCLLNNNVQFVLKDG